MTGPDTHLNERIAKLASRGLTDEQIARKIGRPDHRGLRRVRKVTNPPGDGMEVAIQRSIDSAKKKREKENEQD